MDTHRTQHEDVSFAVPRRAAQARIVTFACAGLGVAVIAIIGGWAITNTLEDWETVVGGLLFGGLLAGFAALARRGHPSLSAVLLAGLLFVFVTADTAYYGLGSPLAAALLLPVLLIACTLGLKPGLAAAILGAAAVFGIAWASLSGILATEMPAAESHLSFTAPLISVILFFGAGLAGAAVEEYQKALQTARQPNG